MAPTVATADRSALPVRAEKCAKADLRKSEALDYRTRVGKAVERARQMRGWSNDELSNQVSRDARQVARWQNGDERPHLDALFAVEDALFRNALVVALAELGTGVEIDTVIRLRLKESA